MRIYAAQLRSYIAVAAAANRDLVRAGGRAIPLTDIGFHSDKIEVSWGYPAIIAQKMARDIAKPHTDN